MNDKLLFGSQGFANITTKQGIVLHSGPDDYGLKNTGTSSTNGNSGSRLACGCFINYAAKILVSFVVMLSILTL